MPETRVSPIGAQMKSPDNIRIPNDVDKALKACLDYAEQGVIVPLQKLLEKFNGPDDHAKILAHYKYIQRVQISANNLVNKPDSKESISKYLLLIIAGTTLSLSFLAVIGAICWLSIAGSQIPGTLTTLASVLIGYVGGIATGILGIKFRRQRHGGSDDD